MLTDSVGNYLSNENWKAAEKSQRKLLKILEAVDASALKRADSLEVLAQILVREKKYGEAKKTCMTIFSLNSLSGERERHLREFLAFNILPNLQEYSLSEEMLTTIWQEENRAFNRCFVLGLLGKVYEKDRKWDEAQQAYKKGIEIAKTDDDSGFFLAHFHSRLGNLWIKRDQLKRAEESFIASWKHCENSTSEDWYDGEKATCIDGLRTIYKIRHGKECNKIEQIFEKNDQLPKSK